MNAYRCLVADDHPALLAAVSSYLDANGFELVGTAADGREALQLAEAAQPDVALVDFRMPRLGGVELVEHLHEAVPDARILVYTADARDAEVSELLAAGAHGVVLKEAPLVDLVRALKAVLDGRAYVDPAYAGLGLVGPARRTELTQRETEVLHLLSEGLSYEAIGKRLSISAETVRTHVRKACERLGAATSTQAVATALRQRLIG
ncbi:MAG TPA: response regulator transcription factor [Gaiellaceae bacterium]|jgi:DNA-binding NarL/FixJ family response regulator|nr:response regulator transcription factor [Gaiellaceae bacterium]